MMIALAAVATALAPVERLYLSYGHRANSFSAAFDPDLERHVTDQGFVAFARHECTKTSLAFFDPVCAEAHMETVLDSFMERERQRGRRRLLEGLDSDRTLPLRAARLSRRRRTARSTPWI